MLTWPVAARPHQILDIHLAEPYQVRIDCGPAKTSPETAVVGPQTYRRAHVHLSGQIHVFNILFQPTGLNRLVGINMTSLVNQDPAASDVLGKAAAVLGDTVCAAPDFQLRVAAVERWVGMMLDKGGPDGTIGLASRQMIALRGRARIEDLVAICVIVELPKMHKLVDRAGIGLEVSDQLLVVAALLERRKANLLIELHRLGHCAAARTAVDTSAGNCKGGRRRRSAACQRTNGSTA